MTLQRSASRFKDEFIKGGLILNSDHCSRAKTAAGRWRGLKWVFGIDTINYRLFLYEGFLDKYENVRPDVQSHNYCIQMVLETGLIGFVLGSYFCGPLSGPASGPALVIWITSLSLWPVLYL